MCGLTLTAETERLIRRGKYTEVVCARENSSVWFYSSIPVFCCIKLVSSIPVCMVVWEHKHQKSCLYRHVKMHDLNLLNIYIYEKKKLVAHSSSMWLTLEFTS